MNIEFSGKILKISKLKFHLESLKEFLSEVDLQYHYSFKSIRLPFGSFFFLILRDTTAIRGG